jgi:hypothetical protein
LFNGCANVDLSNHLFFVGNPLKIGQYMDTRYLLHTLMDGSLHSTQNYEFYKLKSERRGCFKINDIYVYTTELSISTMVVLGRIA